MKYYPKSLKATRYAIYLPDFDYINKKIYFEFNTDALRNHNALGLNYISPGDGYEYYLEMYTSVPSYGIGFLRRNGSQYYKYTGYSATYNPGVAVDFKNNIATFYTDGTAIVTLSSSTNWAIRNLNSLYWIYFGDYDNNISTYTPRFFPNECIKGVPEGYQTLSELAFDKKIIEEYNYIYGYK